MNMAEKNHRTIGKACQSSPSTASRKCSPQPGRDLSGRCEGLAKVKKNDCWRVRSSKGQWGKSQGEGVVPYEHSV